MPQYNDNKCVSMCKSLPNVLPSPPTVAGRRGEAYVYSLSFRQYRATNVGLHKRESSYLLKCKARSIPIGRKLDMRRDNSYFGRSRLLLAVSALFKPQLARCVGEVEALPQQQQQCIHHLHRILKYFKAGPRNSISTLNAFSVKWMFKSQNSIRHG